MDPATYSMRLMTLWMPLAESTEPQELPEFVESIGPNYVILYTYIEREEDVPVYFHIFPSSSCLVSVLPQVGVYH